jgi:hypothetical protein
MDFYEHNGALIEVSVLSDGVEGSDGWVVEFWDVTPGGDGELLHIHFDADGIATVERVYASVDQEFINWALVTARSNLGK